MLDIDSSPQSPNPQPNVDDAAVTLVERVRALFVENIDAVYNVAYRVLWSRSDAEDVVQQTFVKALTRMNQLEQPTRVRPWLLQIAYRESISTLRQRRDVTTDPSMLPESPTSMIAPDEAAVASAISLILRDALLALSHDERMAVVLRDVEQLPMAEVASVLGIGLSAAKMRVHRGRQSLRTLIETKGIT